MPAAPKPETRRSNNPPPVTSRGCPAPSRVSHASGSRLPKGAWQACSHPSSPHRRTGTLGNSNRSTNRPRAATSTVDRDPPFSPNGNIPPATNTMPAGQRGSEEAATAGLRATTAGPAWTGP